MSACSMHAVGGSAISSNRTGATRGTESVRTAQGLLRFGGGFVSGNVSGPEGVREERASVRWFLLQGSDSSSNCCVS